MGAGSSSEQRSPEQPEAGSAAAPAEPQAGGGAPEPEAAPSSPGDPEIHAAGDPSAKVFQKNGQLSAVGSLTEQGELSLQEGAQDGQEDMVIVTDVGQRGSEDVSERASVKDMAANPPEAQDPPKDGLEETPEILEQASPSEGNQEEEPAPAPESQTSDVGFKKVFKFVGLKFTVKRDKNDKSDAVQLLTLKKEDSEAMTEGSQGAGDHPEPSPAAGEAASKEDELRQSTEKPPEMSPQGPASLPEEPEQPAEGGREEAGEKTEKEPPKPVESPTSPQASETASPFRKFFTQGWAGWRKKTSFRKPKDEELEVSEKKEPETKTAEQQREGDEGPDASEKPPGAANEARLSAEYEKVELPADEAGEGPPRERTAPLATEVFDEKVETVAEVHVSPEEQSHEGEGAVGSPERPQAQVETDKEPQRAEPAEKEDQQQEEEKTLEASTSGGDLSQGPEFSPSEGVLSEAELLASQERTRPQGSPLKKLFSSSGLKKLSSKKQKSRRAGAEEETGERPLESPDSPAEEQKGDSSASSPEEPEEPTVLEKATTEGARDPEAQEGPVSSSSEGEKKREGSTPWASFKKMVTPKKRARRPSDSDREDELDKVKSATLSSAESATSDLLETETRGGTEEPKRRVDTSVSWEALICVGSSKKRARKASSSDEDEGPKATVSGEGQKPDEAAEKDRDTVTAETQAAAAASQEPDAGTGGSSPEQAGTPSEGEGISTWESFKRLVTPRKRAKAKVEEKHEEPTPGLEPPAATEVEAAGSGREESWVSIKKLIPGRKKKRPEGKPEQAPAGGGPEEDSEDVPAVVPLSEFDAAEREKAEARGASPSEQEEAGPVHVSEEASQSLVHTVRVTVVDGAKAVSDLEERSPSWISASVPGPLEQDATVVAETARGAEAAATALPESRDVSRDTLASEVEVTSEAVTAAETTGASGAEETTDMVSAVSQLTESPATTEEATPVQEAEGGPVDGAELERRTQAVLLAVVEKVSSEALPGGPGDLTPEGTEKAESGRWAGDDNKEEGVFSQELDPGIQTETLTLSEAAPEGPPGKECRESAELQTPHPAGENAEVVGAKSEVVLEQGTAAPDSSETLTDSETNESSPVTEFEAVGSVQQDGVVDSLKDDEAVASASKSKAPEGEAAPARSEMSPVAPCGLPSSGEGKDHLEPEEVLEHRHGETTVEPAPALSKMVLESRPDAREKGQETAGAREQERSADGAGQEALPAAALPEGAAGEAEGEGSDLQSQPGERVGGVEQAEAEPGQTPALATGSRERGHVKVTFTEDAKEGLSLEEIPSRVQEEAAGTEIQSPGLSPAAVARDKAGGESVESLETPEHLESAPSAQAERVEDGPVQSEERAGASGTESRAASAPTEEDFIPEPDGDGTQARAAARETTRKTEGQSLLFEAQSNKLVQDVIQAVVEQLVSGEGTSTEALQGPGPPARGKESALQAEEESRAVVEAEEQAASDVSREESEASEKLTPSEVVQGPSVNDQQVEEAGEAARAESGLQGGGGSVGAEVVACSEHPNPAPEDSETSGGFTKESPDANGPKLTEEEGRREEEFLTGKAEGNQSEKELKMGAPVETSQPAEN